MGKWEMVRLGDVCGYAPKSSIKAGEGQDHGKYKFFTSSNEQTKYLDEYTFDFPALIFGTGGNASIHYCETPFSVSTDCFVLYTMNEGVNLKAIYRYLSGNMHILEAGFRGAGLKHISKKYLSNNVLVPMPPFEIQKQISDLLDNISVLIEKRKVQIDKMDLLLKSKFIEMFGDPVINVHGWDKVYLNDICDGIGDGLHGTPQYSQKGIYPFINGNNLEEGKINITSNTKFVDEEEYKKYNKELSSNAILLSINGTLGRLAFYNGEQVVLGKSACYCNINSTANRVFIYGIMKTKGFLRYLDDNATRSTIKNVGLKAIREYQAILPPISLQNQFASFTKLVETQKFLLECSLAKLVLSNKSLIQKCFRGEIFS